MSQRPPRNALRPRKAPRQARAEETVTSIIEAAAQVLEANGFEGFNTNAVSRRAGVSIGSLYQYFPGKDALMLALIQRGSRQFLDDAAIALSKRSGKAALEHLVGAAVRQQLQRPMLARLLDVAEGRPALRDEAANPELEALCVKVVERAAPALSDPGTAAADVFAIIRGMVDAAGERGEHDLEYLEQRVRTAVFGYLRPGRKKRTQRSPSTGM